MYTLHLEFASYLEVSTQLETHDLLPNESTFCQAWLEGLVSHELFKQPIDYVSVKASVHVNALSDLC